MATTSGRLGPRGRCGIADADCKMEEGHLCWALLPHRVQGVLGYWCPGLPSHTHVGTCMHARTQAVQGRWLLPQSTTGWWLKSQAMDAACLGPRGHLHVHMASLLAFLYVSSFIRTPMRLDWGHRAGRRPPVGLALLPGWELQRPTGGSPCLKRAL